jgi:hypothetical protein
MYSTDVNFCYYMTLTIGAITTFIERIVLLEFIHRLVSQKIEELKIYITNITIHTSTKFTQVSITNHRATYPPHLDPSGQRGGQ